jgi:hypothetical protein
MYTAAQPTSHFQAGPDPISVVSNFDMSWVDHHTAFKAAGGYHHVSNLFPRPAKVAVTPADSAIGQIDILWKLDKKTLERMATNPLTPVVVLERLADHPMAEVRAAVSENKSTPKYVILALSKDADCEVRYQLAENHSLSLDVIEALTNDENPYVACRAQQTYDRLKADKATSNFDFLTAIVTGSGGSSWKTDALRSFI